MASSGNGISLPVSLHIENLLKIINDLKSLLGNLKVGSSGFKAMENNIRTLLKELDKFLILSSKPFLNESQFVLAEKSVNKLEDEIERVSITASRLKFSDLELNAELKGLLKAVEDQINTIKASLRTLKEEAKNSFALSDLGLKWLDLHPDDATRTLDQITNRIRKAVQDLNEEVKKAEEVVANYKRIITMGDIALNVAKSTRGLKSDNASAVGLETLMGKEFSDFFTKHKDGTVAGFKAGQRGFFEEWLIKNFNIDPNVVKDLVAQSAPNIAKALNDANSAIREELNKTIAGAGEAKTNLPVANIKVAKLNTELSTLTAYLKLATDANGQMKLSEDLLREALAAAGVTLENTKESIASAARSSEELRSANARGTAELNSLREALLKTNSQFLQQQRITSNFNAMKMMVVNFMGFRQVLNLTKTAIREAINHIRELDTVMNKISIVTDMDTHDLWQQVDEYSRMAQAYGTTIKGAYEVSLIYYQQGLQTADVLTLTNETLKLAKISGLDYALTTDYMTTALRGFKMEMSDASTVVDVYSNLAAHTAVTQEELAVAMSKTASSMESVGSSFELSSAMIATMVAVTRESATNIGSALKSIAARYGEMKKDPGALIDSEGEIMAYNKVDAALQSVGISLKTTDGQFRSFTDVIIELSEKWNTLESTQQRYIATLFAGNRQQSRFLALVSNADLLKANLNYAENSEDVGTLQALKTLDSIESKTEQVRVAYQLMYTTIGAESIWKVFLDGAKETMNTLNSLPKLFGKIPIGAISMIYDFVTVIKNVGFLALRGLSKAWDSLLPTDLPQKARQAAEQFAEAYNNTLKNNLELLKPGEQMSLLVVDLVAQAGADKTKSIEKPTTAAAAAEPVIEKADQIVEAAAANQLLADSKNAVADANERLAASGFAEEFNTAILAQGIDFTSITDESQNAINNLITGIMANLKEVFEAFKAVGDDALAGFISGLLEKLDVASDTAALVGTAAVQAIRQALNSHSPSLETMLVGLDFVNGLALGIRLRIDLAVKAGYDTGALTVAGLEKALEVNPKNFENIKNAILTEFDSLKDEQFGSSEERGSLRSMLEGTTFDMFSSGTANAAFYKFARMRQDTMANAIDLGYAQNEGRKNLETAAAIGHLDYSKLIAALLNANSIEDVSGILMPILGTVPAYALKAGFDDEGKGGAFERGQRREELSSSLTSQLLANRQREEAERFEAAEAEKKAQRAREAAERAETEAQQKREREALEAEWRAAAELATRNQLAADEAYMKDVQAARRVQEAALYPGVVSGSQIPLVNKEAEEQIALLKDLMNLRYEALKNPNDGQEWHEWNKAAQAAQEKLGLSSARLNGNTSNEDILAIIDEITLKAYGPGKAQYIDRNTLAEQSLEAVNTANSQTNPIEIETKTKPIDSEELREKAQASADAAGPIEEEVKPVVENVDEAKLSAEEAFNAAGPIQAPAEVKSDNVASARDKLQADINSEGPIEVTAEVAPDKKDSTAENSEPTKPETAGDVADKAAEGLRLVAEATEMANDALKNQQTTSKKANQAVTEGGQLGADQLRQYKTEVESTTQALHQQGNAAKNAGEQVKKADVTKILGQIGPALTMLSSLFNKTSEGGRIAAGAVTAVGGALRVIPGIIKGINAGLSSMPWMAIAMGIMAIVNGISMMWESDEERLERLTKEAEELENKAKAARSEYKNLDTSKKKLDELEKKRYESAEAAEEYQTAAEELAEKFPELISRFDEAGNVILDTTNSEQVLADARKKAAEAAYEAAEAELKVGQEEKRLAIDKAKKELRSARANLNDVNEEDNDYGNWRANLVDALRAELDNLIKVEQGREGDHTLLLNHLLNAKKTLDADLSYVTIQEYLTEWLGQLSTIEEEGTPIDTSNLQTILAETYKGPEQVADAQLFNNKFKFLLENLEKLEIGSPEFQDAIRNISEFLWGASAFGEELTEDASFKEAVLNFNDFKALTLDIQKLTIKNDAYTKTLIGRWQDVQQNISGMYRYVDDSSAAASMVTTSIFNKFKEIDKDGTLKVNDNNLEAVDRQLDNARQRMNDFWKLLGTEDKKLFESMATDTAHYSVRDFEQAFDIESIRDIIETYYNLGITNLQERLSENLEANMTVLDKETGKREDKYSGIPAYKFKTTYEAAIKQALTKQDENFLNTLLDNYTSLLDRGLNKSAYNYLRSAFAVWDNLLSLPLEARNNVYRLIELYGITTREGLQNIIDNLKNNDIQEDDATAKLLTDLANKIPINLSLAIQTLISNFSENWSDDTKLYSKLSSGLDISDIDTVLRSAAGVKAGLTIDDFEMSGDDIVLASDKIDAYLEALIDSKRDEFDSYKAELDRSADVLKELKEDTVIKENTRIELEKVLGEGQLTKYMTNADGVLVNYIVNWTDFLKDYAKKRDQINKEIERGNQLFTLGILKLKVAEQWKAGDYSSLGQSIIEVMTTKDKYIVSDSAKKAKKLAVDATSNFLKDLIEKGIEDLDLDSYEGLPQEIRNSIKNELINEGLINVIHKYALLINASLSDMNEWVLQAYEEQGQFDKFSNDAIKDLQFINDSQFTATSSELKDLANRFLLDLADLLTQGLIFYDKSLGEYVVNWTSIEGLEGLTEVEGFLATVVDSINSLFDLIANLIKNGLSGSLNNVDREKLTQWASKQGIQDLSFRQTADGWKLIESSAVEVVNKVRELDVLLGEVLFQELTKNLTSANESFSTIGALMAEVADIQRDLRFEQLKEAILKNGVNNIALFDELQSKGNVKNLYNRPHIDNGDGSYSTLYTSTLDSRNFKSDIPWVMNITPITPDGKTFLSDEELEAYVQKLISGSDGSILGLLDEDKKELGLILEIADGAGQDMDKLAEKLGDRAELLHEISEAYEAIKNGETYNSDKIKQYKEELRLRREILATYSTQEDSSFNFMSNKIPGGQNNPINLMENWGTAFSKIHEATKEGWMDYKDYYNILTAMSLLADITDQAVPLGQKVAVNAENVAELIAQGAESLRLNTKTGKYLIDLSGLSQIGIDFEAAGGKMEENVTAGLLKYAKAQIDMLDGIIQVLEVVVAMENLGKITGGEDEINLANLFPQFKTDTNVEKAWIENEKVIEWISTLLQAGPDSDLGKALENIKLNSLSLKELLTNAIKEGEGLSRENAELLTLALQSFYKAYALGDYNLDSLYESLKLNLAASGFTGTFKLGDETITILNGTTSIKTVDGKYLAENGLQYDSLKEAMVASKQYLILLAQEESPKAIEYNAFNNKGSIILKNKQWEFEITSDGQLEINNKPYNTLDEFYQSLLTEYSEYANLEEFKVDLKLKITPKLDIENGLTPELALKIRDAGIKSYEELVNEWNKYGDTEKYKFKAKYGVDLEGVDLADEQLKIINELLNDETKTVNIEVSDNGTVNLVQEAIDGIHGKKVTVEVEKTDLPSNSKTENNGLVEGKGEAKGTLMGELGPEMVVSNGRYFVVGQNGPEMVDLADDAIVFNHLLTKSLLNKGSVGTHGTAITSERAAISFAKGNVFGGPAQASASAALAAMQQLRSQWQSILNMTAKDLASKGGGGGGGGGDKKDATFLKDLERWYNLLQEIAKLELKITYQEQLRATIQANLNKNGSAYYKSQKESYDYLKRQVAAQQELALELQDYFNKRRTELNKNNGPFSSLYEFDEEGQLKYKKGKFKWLSDLAGADPKTGKANYTVKQQYQKLVKAGYGKYMQYDSEGNKIDTSTEEGMKAAVQAFWDKMEADKKEMQDLHDSVEEHKKAVLEAQAKQSEILKEIQDNQIAVEDAVLDAVVNASLKEIDELSKLKDAIQEANENLLNGLSEALERERNMYENQQSEADLTSKRRRLALLQRSGGSTAEINSLQAEIDSSTRDLYFLKQLDLIDTIQKASDLLIEKLDKLIQLLQDTLDYAKENGLLWGKVYEVMLLTPTDIWEYVKAHNPEYLAMSATKIGQETQDLLFKAEQWSQYRDDIGEIKDVLFGKTNKEWEAFNLMMGDKNNSTSKKWNKLTADLKSSLLEIYMKEFNASGDANKAAEAVRKSKLYKEIYGKKEDKSDAKSVLSKLLTTAKKTITGENFNDTGKKTTNSSKNNNQSKKAAKYYVITGYENVHYATTTEAKQAKEIMLSGILEHINSATRKEIRQHYKDSYDKIKKAAIVGKYKDGGLNDITGLAMLHGTKKEPEAVLNAPLTKILRDNILSNKPNSLINLLKSYNDAYDGLSAGTYNSINSDNGTVIEHAEVNLHIDKLANSYDSAKAADDVMREMLNIARKTKAQNRVGR